MKKLMILVVCLCVAGVSQAAVFTWTGATGAFFDELNWDDGIGGNPAAGTIDGGAAGTNPILADLVINSGIAQGEAPGFGQYVTTAAGYSLALTGGVLDLMVGGANGVDGDGALNLSGASTVNAQFVVGDVVASLADTSVLTLRGAGGAMGGTASVDLIGLDARAYFTAKTVAEVNSQYLARFTVGGVAAVDGVNVTVYSDDGVGDGTYVQAIVPEPATMALLGLGGLFLRRRKA